MTAGELPEPVAVAQTVQLWMRGGYRVFRAESTRSAFTEFVPALIDGLAVYTRVTDGMTAAQARRIALVEVERLRSVKTPSPQGRRSRNSRSRET